MSDGARPRAREGLLASDHSKRGRRFVTVVDPDTLAATLLEPWEHAILVLCDGSRSTGEIVDLLAPEVEGQAIDREVVWRCLKFFERQRLISNAGLRHSDAPPPGPVTVNELQRAYAEWHKSPDDPAPGAPPPIPRTSPKIRAGLDPTVSPSSKSMLTGVRSLLDAAGDSSDEESGDEPIPDLLAALDDAVAEASRVDQSERAAKARARPAVEVQEVESRPATSGLFAAARGGVVVADELQEDAKSAPQPVTTLAPPARPTSPVRASVRPEAASGERPASPREPELRASNRPSIADAAAPRAYPREAPRLPGVPRPAVKRRPKTPLPPEPERAAGGFTEPTMRLADLLATDATEPATITLHPLSPTSGVRLRDEDAVEGEGRGVLSRGGKDVPTQLGSLVKKRSE